ncbi:MAG: hypothetical protein GX161_04375 [Firmicutes bacterium]|jgi:hypothetical protein|nr:hypothetical protein [Bacillota bacterium]
MRLVLVLLAMAAIAWYEGPPLIRNRLWREAVIFAVLWLIALAYSAAVALGWKVPNPMDWIDWVFSPVTPIGGIPS